MIAKTRNSTSGALIVLNSLLLGGSLPATCLAHETGPPVDVSTDGTATSGVFLPANYDPAPDTENTGATVLFVAMGGMRGAPRGGGWSYGAHPNYGMRQQFPGYGMQQHPGYGMQQHPGYGMQQRPGYGPHPGYGGHIPSGFPVPFYSITFLPVVASAGLVGSAYVGQSLDDADRPAFQREMVKDLENRVDGDARAFQWRGNVAEIDIKATATTTLDASIRRKRTIDALPSFTMVSEVYSLNVASPVYSGLSVDKPEVEYLQEGAQILLIGFVLPNRDWVIAGRNNEAIGYLPADRVQKEPPAAVVAYRASNRNSGSVQTADSTTDIVRVDTTCRALEYKIRAANGAFERNGMAACKTAEGGWVEAAGGPAANFEQGE